MCAMFRARLELALLFAFLTASQASAYSCQWNGFDLSPLEQNNSDYRQTMGLGGMVYYLNACRDVVTAASIPACAEDCAACQTWTGGAACLGNSSTATWAVNGDSVSLNVTGGSMGRNFVIDFLCSQSAGKGSPSFFEEDSSSRTYYFQWASAYACSPWPPPPPPSASPSCDQHDSCEACAGPGTGCVWCTDHKVFSGCVASPVNQTECANAISLSTYCALVNKHAPAHVDVKPAKQVKVVN